ncbi:MAG: sigma-70 family RNA polymerase sigma factor [Myxococcales bacterium]|nr:sigma-70 family RNA polymerase sigma factor [Myxococcales bacterium]
MVSRRVPRTEVDDVVQSVLCDALAAGNVPPDPAEVPRWVMGIARHKIADFHRRAGRFQPEAAVEAMAVDPVEDRDLLQRVVGETARCSSNQRVLGWIMREHAGDHLYEIAAEEDLPADVVRKRVSRFRQVLRARWLWAAAASFALLVLALRAGSSIEPRRLDGHQLVAGHVDRTLRVVDLDLPQTVDPSVAAVLEAEARLTTVTLRGDAVTVESPSRRLHGRLVTRSESHATLRLDDGRTFPLELDVTTGQLVIRTGGATVVVE